MIIDGNISRTSSSADLLGLIANNFVRVMHPVCPSNRSRLHDGTVTSRRRRATATADNDGNRGVNGTGSHSNPNIDAAILAIDHSFIVDHYDCGAQLGDADRERRDRAEVPRRGRDDRRRPATSRTTTTTTACATRSRRTSSTRCSRPGTCSARPWGSGMFPVASLAFVGGMVTGSFVGLVAHRLPRGAGRSSGPGPSAIPAARRSRPTTTCRSLSWLLLRGRCRSCQARIPARYPLIELAVGAAFAATAIVLRRRPSAARSRAALRRDARGDHADRSRAKDHPQRDPAGRRGGGRRCGRRDRPRQPPGPGDRRRSPPAGSCSLSPSPIRVGWAWVT